MFLEIAIIPIDPNITCNSWKDNLTKVCDNRDDIKECLQQNSYSYEAILTTMDDKSFMMTTPFHGIISWISPSKGSIEFSRMKTLSIDLQPSLAYKIILADPSFKIVSSNPTTVPITGIKQYLNF